MDRKAARNRVISALDEAFAYFRARKPAHRPARDEGTSAIVQMYAYYSD